MLALLASAVALTLTGLGSASAADKLKVALLTPSLTNDGSFNQVALDAVKKLAAEGVIEFELREKMADPAASEPVIRQYASKGYDLIIGHGIEISEPILKVAADFPKVHFAASGGPDLAGKLLPNVNGWTYDFGQLGYLGGFVAGSLKDVKTVGVIGGPPLPFILATHKGFKVALQEKAPSATIIETLTGSFDDSQKAAEATRGAIAQGANIIWTSGDGIGSGIAAAAAAQPGVVTLGVTGEAGGLAPKVNITSVVLDMYPTYKYWISAIKDGTYGKNFYVSGLGNKGLVLSPINNIGGLVPDGLDAQIAALVEELASGKKTLPNFFE
jgi:basic membrane lipoprotein Med (substrate-binding protein (PBP1-ABC) superfamily)